MEIISIILALLLLAASALILKLWSANQDLKSELHWTYADMLRTATANANHAAAEKDSRQTAMIERLQKELDRRDKVAREDDSYSDLVSHCINLRLEKKEAREENEDLRERLRRLSKANRVVEYETVREVVYQADPVVTAEMARLRNEIATQERQAIHEKAEKEGAATFTKEKIDEIQNLQGQIKTLRKDLDARNEHKTGPDESDLAQHLQKEKYEHNETKQRLEHSESERKKMVSQIANERQRTDGTTGVQQLKIELSETQQRLKQIQYELEKKSTGLATEKTKVGAMEAAFQTEVREKVDQKTAALRSELNVAYEKRLDELVQEKIEEYNGRLAGLVKQQVDKKIEEMNKAWNTFHGQLTEENARKMNEHTAKMQEELEKRSEEAKNDWRDFYTKETSRKWTEMQENADNIRRYDTKVIQDLQNDLEKAQKSQQQPTTYSAYSPQFQLPTSPAYVPYMGGNFSPTTPSYVHQAHAKPAAPTTPFSPSYRGPMPGTGFATSAHVSSAGQAYSPTSPLAKSTMAGAFSPPTKTKPVPNGNIVGKPSSKEPVVGEKHGLVTDDEGLNPKRQRAPDTPRDVLGGPVVGAKRGREEGDEAGPEAKKAYMEDGEWDGDESLGWGRSEGLREEMRAS